MRWVLEVHHGGHFVTAPQKEYVGGMVEFMRDMDSDTMSYFELLHIREELREPKICKMFHMLFDFRERERGIGGREREKRAVAL